MDKPRVIAHRGYSSKFRENTWDAFEGAYSVGAHMIELDLVLTKDRKIWVNHDLEMDGRLVRDLTLEEAKVLVPGSMEISEVLSWAQERGIGLYLDIKDREMINELTEVLKDFGHGASIVVSSSDDFPFMRRFKELNDHILTALLFRNLLPPEDMVTFGKKYHGDIIHPCWEDKHSFPHTLISEEDIRHMTSEGFEVVCWHEEREDELRELVKKGFWGITTNDPAKLVSILKES
ncbi:glycerophosphodiester phosphodiesterase [Hydrogenivirga sp. 128-5-R1-1]|uniref:glycerophosphodiester phosphodiesterase n=1 Tax=Hydrogenivirga sp. 128-5-R1-1 TaxID=392423 RepID=UPI00015EF825|nr:glycerophosphodiester phosphodiesterase [Hydrogenivirga sp. 128-5-R1-1]EDP75764.1 probable glycerophosphoryl diester phosphodiesterase protein [Hydrogenivirga sp. 128-5-R1-1]